jgi:hypothetical protein
MVACASANRYIAHKRRWPPGTKIAVMRAETEKLVEDIKQSVGLLRRHL